MYELSELLCLFLSEKFIKDDDITLKACYVCFVNFISQNSEKLEISDVKAHLIEKWRYLDNFRAAWQNTLEYSFFDILTPGAVRQLTTFYYLTGLFRGGLRMYSAVERRKFFSMYNPAR